MRPADAILDGLSTVRTAGRRALLGRPVWAWLLALAAVTPLVWPGPEGSRLENPANVTWSLVCVVLVAAGWVLVGHPAQRRNGALMLLQALTQAVDAFRSIDPGPWALLVYLESPAVTVLLAILLLRWPAERLRTRPEVWTLRYAWCSLLLFGLLYAVTWDPAWGGYHGRAWWPTLSPDRRLNHVLASVQVWNKFVLLAVFLLLIALRVQRSTRPERIWLVPVLLSVAALATATVGRLLYNLAGRYGSDAFSSLENVAWLTVPVAVLVATAVRRVQRALAVEALSSPSRLPDPAAVRTALARALGDRSLTLALWSPERDRYVSTDGVPLDGEEPGRLAVDATGADGTALARVTVDPRLADNPELVRSVVRTAGAALDHARLQAELRARQREMAESTAELARARGAERSLSRLVPGGLAERLRADPEAFQRTERLTVTVLMSDIRGYTGIAETTAPAELARQLNEHRRAMNAVLLGEGGTVMQYVGDAVLAVFGAPDPLPAHEDAALRAATAMHRAQERLNGAWAAQGLPAFGLGIGVCTGEVAAAFLGSDERVEYTVVGDTVNLAARLTDAARPAGTTLAAAATVAGAAAGWHVVLLPPLQVRGRATPVSACSVLPPVPEQDPVPHGAGTAPAG